MSSSIPEPIDRRRIVIGLAAVVVLGGGVNFAWEYLHRVGRRRVGGRIEGQKEEAKTPEREERGPRRERVVRREQMILPKERDYAMFLTNLELRHISPNEILSPHRRERNGVANVLPPREMWAKIAPTLTVADELRARLGCKLRYITSAYRSPAYNAQCPGAASGSQHTKNTALDLVYDCPPKVAMKEALAMRDEGIFEGGLGLYKTFIHIDTRGRNATW